MSNLDDLITLDDLPDLLHSYLDPNMPYQRWSKVGRAIYSQFGDSATDIFENWSACGSSYNKTQFNYWWKNFKKVTRTGFGSLIYELKQAGWKPKTKSYSEEEKQQRKAAIEEAKAKAAQKRQQAEAKQWQDLKVEEKQFHSLDKYDSPSPYFLEKHMADANRFIDLRQGVDKYGKHYIAWPIWSELGNQGLFCGYERILDKKFMFHGKRLNKFSSDAARTDIGFATFGSAESSRIFVVGGFADAYAAHVGSGETIVTPIGEANIVAVVKHLRQQFPDKSIIAAPDNDNQGWSVIDQCGGMWSLPRAEKADWSDVWINEGTESLVQQLNAVQGFEHIKSNDRYLQAKIRRGLNLLKSDMGTGKTKTVIDYITENPNDSVLVISHRRSLAKSLRGGINRKVANDDQAVMDDTGFQYYEDLVIKSGNGVDSNAALRSCRRLVCSVDSLWRLAGTQFDCIFFDEIQQGIGHFYADTNRHAENCLRLLQFFLTHSKTQILADAHLGDLTFSFCKKMGLYSGVFYENTYQVGQGKTLYIYDNKAQLTEAFTNTILGGKQCYCYSNVKAEVKKLATAVRQHNERGQWFGELLEVHADSAKSDKSVMDAITNIAEKAPNLDVLIASPTLGTGFDIPRFKDGTGHRFSMTFGLLSSNVGTAEEGHQGLNRAREVNEFHVWVDNTTRTEPLDPDYIYTKLVEEVSQETASMLKIDPETGQWARNDELYESLFAEVKAYQNLSKNNYQDNFIRLAKESGYKVVVLEKDEMATEFGKVTREEAGHRNDRQLLREIEQAPLHVDSDYEDMVANSENITHAEYNKSRVAKALNLMDASESEIETLYPLAAGVYSEFAQPGDQPHLNPIADAAVQIPENKLNAIINAMAFLQEKSHFSSKISKLSLLSLPLDNAKELDRRNIMNSLSRARWEHKSIRKRHLMRLLSAAGINDRLEYNGAMWSKAEVAEKLQRWMMANQDALYKYSGTRISEAALADPVQWFNGHLRANGVPVVSLGQRRVKGTVARYYAVDRDQWDQIKTLIDLRNRGISEYLANADAQEPPKELQSQSVTPCESVIYNSGADGVTLNPAYDLSNQDNSAQASKSEREGAKPLQNQSLDKTVSRLIDMAHKAVNIPLDYLTLQLKDNAESWMLTAEASLDELRDNVLVLRDLYLFDCAVPAQERKKLEAFSW
ncbi:MAG: plasmid replication protein, CyRepA1 family [Rickettsiales bacterium]